MTTLALIRHGETDWNRRGLIQGVTDVPLNETGLAQAARAAEELVSYPLARDWAGVVTSPLVRAFATGLVIAHSLSIPMLEPMPQLAERDYGEAEGMEVVRAKDLYPAGDYPGSEDNDLVFERSLSAIDDLRRVCTDGALVLVAHGGLLHTLLSRLHGERLPSINNATVNLLEHDGDRWLVRAINGEKLAA